MPTPRTVLILAAAGALGTLVAGSVYDPATKITPVRLPMDPFIALSCAKPTQIVGPHLSPEIDLSVNETVLAYRRAHPEGHAYPVGSKFIKEKYSSKDAAAPNLATIMIKRSDKGTIDDWDFKIESLPDHRPLPADDRISCASCHSRFSERGFISEKTEDALREFLHEPPRPSAARHDVFILMNPSRFKKKDYLGYGLPSPPLSIENSR